jgi:hypothetical protein
MLRERQRVLRKARQNLMDWNIDTTTAIAGGIAAGVVLLLLLAGLVFFLVRRRRSRLRDQFGAEYDRTVQRTGDRQAAERELAGRVDRVKSFELRALLADERAHFVRSWRDLQSDFVDHPADAVFRADALLTELMRARGYADVSEGPERRAADLSVYFADEADEYRQFWWAAERGRTGTASTEELRLAFRKLRRVFERLAEPAAEAPEPARERDRAEVA